MKSSFLSLGDSPTATNSSHAHSVTRHRRLMFTENARHFLYLFPDDTWRETVKRTAHASRRRCNWRKTSFTRRESVADRSGEDGSFNLLFRGRCQVQLSATDAIAALDINANDACTCCQGRLYFSVFAEKDSRITSRSRVTRHPQ